MRAYHHIKKSVKKAIKKGQINFKKSFIRMLELNILKINKLY